MGLDHGIVHKRKGSEEVNFSFRKENHLHRYFLDACPLSVDSGSFRVPARVIKDLESRLLQVIASLENNPHNTEIAEDLLPTQAGFFFGGTEYDKYYLESCRDALVMCQKILAAKPVGTITYWSWW